VRCARSRHAQYPPLSAVLPRLRSPALLVVLVQARPPLPMETSVPGVFAVGDVRHGSTKRVATAVGAGSIAIQFAHQFLAARGRPT
jgi:thioredoxin reductase